MTDPRHELRGGSGGRFALLALPMVWAALLLLLPLVVMVVMSTGSSHPPDGGVVYDGSMAGWTWISRHEDLVARSAWQSARIAAIATLLSVLLATPTAWWIARAPIRRRALLLLLVVVPSWTSFLLRTYAWKILFRTEGPINELLASVGLARTEFLNTEGAVIVGLVYGYLPFAVLPIYIAVERLDRDLIAAARDLGARPLRAFVSVALPLTLPGTIAGAMLVFVPSLAAFVTPALLGGSKTFMIGQLTQDQFMNARDWPLGSALGVAIAVVALLALVPVALGRRAGRSGPSRA